MSRIVNPYRKDFPLFQAEDQKELSLAYLDNAATTQKPYASLLAEQQYYESKNANPHRGAYDLSVEATMLLEETRDMVKHFFTVPKKGEIIFTKGATESLNLLAYSYGLTHLKEGDEILLPISEHHSNLVPWQMVAKQTGCKLVYLNLNEEANISLEEVKGKLSNKTKLVTLAQVSNVTGSIYPVAEIIRLAHEKGAVVIVDGTQAVPHLEVDITELDPDFYVCSGHKLYGPMGVGILYGKMDLLNQMSPFLYGGDMIEYVEDFSATYAPVPQKFEAGTQNMGSIAGLRGALSYLEEKNRKQLFQYEEELSNYLLEQLKKVPHVQLVGNKTGNNRIGVVPFLVEDVHPHDVVTILNQDRIAIRAGHHCAQPFHRHLDVLATCRVSLSFYNTKEEIDRLCESLKGVRRWFGYGSERTI